MKNIEFKRVLTKVALIGLVTVGASVLVAEQPASAAESAPVAIAPYAKKVTYVSSFTEFAAALQNASVTEIEIDGEITFTKNVTGVPSRNLIIHGSASEGATIDLGQYWIESTVYSNATMTLSDAEISGDYDSGVFFKGISGWNFTAKNVNFRGHSLAQIDAGTLRVEGQNSFSANGEIAWVKHLVVANGAYIHSNSTNDGGDHGAFTFKGTAYDGTATFEPNSNVNINLLNRNSAIFNGKINKINIGNDVIFSSYITGVGIEFEKSTGTRAVPEFNIGERADVRIFSNGEGAQAKPALKFSQPGKFTASERSKTSFIGSAVNGIVESASGSVFNVGDVDELTFINQTTGPIFSATNVDNTLFNLDPYGVFVYAGGIDEWYVYDTTFTVNIGAKTAASTPIRSFGKNFKVENYDQLTFKGAGEL